MHRSWRRVALAATLSITGALGGFVVAAPAQAQTVESGAVSVSGDPGDSITGGGSYAYSTGSGDRLTTNASADNSHVTVNVNGANDDWWYLTLDAPGSQPLVPGTYDNATRYPDNGAGAGLNLEGNGQGCYMLTGTFTVINAVFGPYGYVQTFDATFEQHCEGGEAAARGEVHIANPPAPAPLDVRVAVATDGTASTISGKAILHGTVTCSQPTSVTLSGVVYQVVKKVLVRGQFSALVDCTPGSAAPWTASATPNDTTPFGKGDAEVSTDASAYDAQYDQYVSVHDTTIVTLTKS